MKKKEKVIHTIGVVSLIMLLGISGGLENDGEFTSARLVLLAVCGFVTILYIAFLYRRKKDSDVGGVEHDYAHLSSRSRKF